MHVVSVISTKGGVGKTTIAASLGGFAADAGLRVLLLDLDTQPTLSSYFELPHRSAGGIYELLASDELPPERIISHTTIANLDVVVSNDSERQLNTLLMNAPDGRLRLRHLLTLFRNDYDLLLLDTQGARSVLLEMALLASNVALSPVTPEILAARELHRGTVQLMRDIAPFRYWGIEPPPLHLLMNRVHSVSSDARRIQQALRDVYREQEGIHTLTTVLPALEAYSHAATLGSPVHRVERRRPQGRRAPSALDSMRQFACELLPQWSHSFAQVTGTARDIANVHG